jgi:hypothetical protein
MDRVPISNGLSMVRAEAKIGVTLRIAGAIAWSVASSYGLVLGGLFLSPGVGSNSRADCLCPLLNPILGPRSRFTCWQFCRSISCVHFLGLFLGSIFVHPFLNLVLGYSFGVHVWGPFLESMLGFVFGVLWCPFLGSIFWVHLCADFGGPAFAFF